MIGNCPHCGHSLYEWLRNGICCCHNCNRPFDSCDYNIILSAAWTAQQRHVTFIEELSDLELSPYQAEILESHIVNKYLTYEDTVSVLDNLKVSKFVS